MDTLKWFPVPGYEYIEITRCGKVRREDFEVTRKNRYGELATFRFRGRELRVFEGENGYLRCVVQKDKKRAPLYHHRLIALTFVEGFHPGYHVNHINGVKTDNRPENLEWIPAAENTHHQWATGLVDLRGHLSSNAKLKPKQVRAIRKALAKGVAPTTLSVIAGVSHSTILKIRDGVSWQNV